MDKRAQVIMLPTEYSNINLYNNMRLIFSKDHSGSSKLNCQHLYIISDDEIKEGDWCYDKSNYKIVRYSHKISGLYFVRGIKHLKEHEGYSVDKDDLKKIIATTDTSLKRAVPQEQLGEKFNDYYPLPEPSQQFIEKYIESYNKGEVITDVLVEYEKIYNGYRHKDGEWQLKLKINPKDNTITIKKIKDSWNREEVINILIGCCGEVSCEDGTLLGKSPVDLFHWIENNL